MAGVLSPVIGLIAAALELFAIIGPGAGGVVSQMQQQLESQGMGGEFTPQQIQTMYQVGITFLLVMLVVLGGLWIMFLVFMRGGRNWARIVITVVGAIWALRTLLGLLGSGGYPIVAVLAVAQLVVVVATIVFAYLAPSNQYFRAIAAKRHADRNFPG
ncbi:hypothetical protein GCM10009854_00520 [Saccharopolyspora halophila]|uniref:Uncharacterized protein n=1 Tax=Saccharopolyspora halophila TaxID=405551 RepID=A0ABN3FGS3_9PSEU